MSPHPHSVPEPAPVPVLSHVITRIWSEGWGLPAFWFGVYVLWLTAFPMSGPLLQGESVRLAWFTLPQALTLLALGRWLTPQVLRRLLPIATLGTALLTLAFALGIPVVGFFGVQAMLVVLGLVSAPLSIQCGLLLGQARWPVAAAAIGLCLGNLGSILLDAVPGSLAGKLAVLACLLPGVLAVRVSPDAFSPLSQTQTQLPLSLWRFLPFVLLFQMVSGLMYSHLWPDYHALPLWPGVELLAYVFTALVAAHCVARAMLGCVLSAMTLAVLAFVIHTTGGPVGQYLGLPLMLGATGLVDMVLLAEVLRRTPRIRAYGYVVGVLVLGLALGEALVMALQGTQMRVALLALVLLNLATVTVFLHRPPPPQVQDGNAPALPAWVSCQLSQQELRVLQAVLKKQSYRDIALSFGISESTVKTYMRRIYQKLNVHRREQLTALFAEGDGQQQPEVGDARDA